MDPLIEGYRKFRAEIWPAERARYEALAHWGQSPETMVIACSDSRVDPQTVFSAVPGELFVVRNVAALVPQYSPDPGHHGTSAALEFGVKVLKVARVVVLGHGQCGGVRAMEYGPPPQARDFIASWVEIGKPALKAAGEAPEASSVNFAPPAPATIGRAKSAIAAPRSASTSSPCALSSRFRPT